MQERKTEQASDLMLAFAEQTGLMSSAHPQRRYLWTDAYAVCNFLELCRQTDRPQYRQFALDLIEQVHWVLGRFREDDSRSGWISGFSDAEGAKHPTAGGLRIGKKRAERKPEEMFDERLEWDRDGQYFHYLTKWVHALARAGGITQNANYVRWAVELAEATHAGFVYSAAPDGSKQMCWKMSTDLSYALVPSMGHHDPLDGLVTAWSLRECSEKASSGFDITKLDRHVSDYMEMCAARDWNTDDALGLGGLLFDAARILRLIGSGHTIDPAVLSKILGAANRGLTTLLSTSILNYPADHRLAFRELGLTIGLHSISIAAVLTESRRLPPREASDIKHLVDSVTRFLPVTEMIEKFWLSNQNQQAPTWCEHRDINMVMLASSLLPASVLGVESRAT